MSRAGVSSAWGSSTAHGPPLVRDSRRASTSLFLLALYTPSLPRTRDDDSATLEGDSCVTRPCVLSRAASDAEQRQPASPGFQTCR